MISHEESGDIDTEPSYLCDAELDDETIGKALSSPLFIQEREEPADRRQAYHSHEESLLWAQSFFAHTRTGRPVHELGSCQKQRSSREMENERIRILLERLIGQILAEVRTEIQKHEVQADSDRSRIQELNGIIDAGDEQLRRDQLLLHEHLSEQHRDLREALILRVFMRRKIWSEFKSQESTNLREEDWSKIKTLSMNSRPEFRNYRMKSSVWMIREILKMLNQYAVDYPTLPVKQRYSHLFRDPGGMLSSPGGLLRNDEPPDNWNTHGISGNVFVNPPASLSRRIQSWDSWRNGTHITACNEWTSNARHSLEDFQRIMERTNKDCRFRIFILTNSLHQQHLLVGR